MSWRGIRVTLGCGHMELRDMPSIDSGEADRWRIGALAACWVCPLRKSRRGGDVAALRQIVNVEQVQASRPPEQIDSIHMYWEGEGN